MLLGGGATLGAAALASPGRSLAPRQPCLRLAHLTDIHLLPEAFSRERLSRALRQLHEDPDRPDLIMQGGDAIFDALEQSPAAIRQQWRCWHEVWRAENQLPVFPVLGNHDIYRRADLQGKRWALDELGMSRPYYSFEAGGWRFFVLDSNHPGLDRPYEARLDEEQWEWLRQELAGARPEQPVCVVSHIPILSCGAFFDGPNERQGDWKVPGRWMHLDARDLKDLFRQYPQVKLCLSGHTHLQDQVRYLGVDYLCNGSLCGDLWKGNYQDFSPGYVRLDLFEDGSFTRRTVSLA